MARVFVSRVACQYVFRISQKIRTGIDWNSAS